MEQRILTYRRRIDDLLAQNDPTTDWNRVLEEHLTQVSFFQHERLIHLIVTVTFAILTVMSALASVWALEVGSASGPALLALTALLSVLLIPYIRHYYILENEVQKMYRQYDRIWGKLGHGLAGMSKYSNDGVQSLHFYSDSNNEKVVSGTD